MTDNDSDLQALRNSIRDVLDAECASARVHQVIDQETSIDTILWSKAAELGWLGLSVSEADGGLGLGGRELAVLYQELGRRTAPIPVMTTLLAADAIAQCGSAAQRQAWLPRIVAGEASVGLALRAPDAPPPTMTVTRTGDTIELSGEDADILDGAETQLILVRARDDDAIDHWIIVEPSVDGVSVRRDPTVDRTRHLATLQCDALTLRADRMLDQPAAEADAQLSAHCALALASDAVGGANAIFELTIEYLKTREQFGRPIGSFQALKHRCADHKVALEASRELVAEAVDLWAENSPETPLHVALATAYACDVFAEVATDALQLHGGIGFTWEHDCHLYLKRAKLNQALGGGSNAHLDYAARLLDRHEEART